MLMMKILKKKKKKQQQCTKPKLLLKMTCTHKPRRGVSCTEARETREVNLASTDENQQE